MSQRRGLFLVIEGIDGSGTTTQSKRLAQWATGGGRAALWTCEPSGGPIGTMIRGVLKGAPDSPCAQRETIALLFAADRLEHLHREIEPALAAGIDVICDRYLVSSLAYQGLHLPTRWIAELNARALRPDITVYLALAAQSAAQRLRARGGDPELFDEVSTQRAIAQRYDDLFATCGEEGLALTGRWLWRDGAWIAPSSPPAARTPTEGAIADRLTRFGDFATIDGDQAIDEVSSQLQELYRAMLAKRAPAEVTALDL